jgi:hypothetical protein
MNTLEIAARNYAANTTGLSLDMIDLMFATNPNHAQSLYETISKFLTGPYGTLGANVEIEADGPNYGDALDDVVKLIDGFVMEVPCECAAISVHEALQSLKVGIGVLADEVLGSDEEEQLELPLGIQDLLAAIFGPNVKFVSLEQAEG